jgi:hypothetical protein
MKTYQTNENGSLYIEGMTIPEGHRFYAQALAEVEAGEAEILPYVEPLPTEADYSAAIQSKLDELAQEEGFDNIHTAVSYADEPAVKSFQDHGIMFREKRSLVWAKSYEIMAEVKAGSRAMPTIDELLAELPF